MQRGRVCTVQGLQREQGAACTLYRRCRVHRSCRVCGGTDCVERRECTLCIAQGGTMSLQSAQRTDSAKGCAECTECARVVEGEKTEERESCHSLIHRGDIVGGRERESRYLHQNPAGIAELQRRRVFDD